MDRIATIQSLVYGAPIENCQSMYPQHDYYLPQWLNPPPYNLSASIILEDDTSNSSTQYNGKHNTLNMYIVLSIWTDFLTTVTLFAKRRVTFKGFFIQARSLIGDTILGSFQPVENSDTAKLIDCPGGTNVINILTSFIRDLPFVRSKFWFIQNAATHVLNLPKSIVNFVWKSPVNFEGEFYFV